MFKLSKSASASPAPSNSDNEYNNDSDYNEDNYNVFRPNKTLADNSNSVDINKYEENSKSNKKHQKEMLEKRLDICYIYYINHIN